MPNFRFQTAEAPGLHSLVVSQSSDNRQMRYFNDVAGLFKDFLARDDY